MREVVMPGENVLEQEVRRDFLDNKSNPVTRVEFGEVLEEDTPNNALFPKEPREGRDDELLLPFPTVGENGRYQVRFVGSADEEEEIRDDLESASTYGELLDAFNRHESIKEYATDDDLAAINLRSLELPHEDW